MRRAATGVTQTPRNFVRTDRATSTFAWALKETVAMLWGKPVVSLFYPRMQDRIEPLRHPERANFRDNFARYFFSIISRREGNENLFPESFFQQLSENVGGSGPLCIILQYMLSYIIQRLIYSKNCTASEWDTRGKVSRFSNQKKLAYLTLTHSSASTCSTNSTGRR